MYKYNKKKFISKTAIQVARMIAQNDDESILLALHRFEGSKTATLMCLHSVDYYYYEGPAFFYDLLQNEQEYEIPITSEELEFTDVGKKLKAGQI